MSESQGLSPNEERWEEARKEIIADWFKEDAELRPKQN